MSELPPLGLSNAIHLLSRDQRGLPTLFSNEVNSTGLRPSRSQIQMAVAPERFEVKTIFLPSGENCGSRSGWVDAMNREGALFLSSVLGPGIRQILESNETRE